MGREWWWNWGWKEGGSVCWGEMKGETGGARCRGFKAEPEEEEEEGRGWSQPGNRTCSLCRCCKGRNTSFWSSPPTNMFQQRTRPLSCITGKKCFWKRTRLCVFSRSSCSKPPLLSVTRRVLGIETFFKMGQWDCFLDKQVGGSKGHKCEKWEWAHKENQK